MSYSPVGDTIAVTKLAYSVYSKVYIVARDAPEQFGELSRDLQTLKSILFRVRDLVNRDADSSYGTEIQNVLRRCFDTLRGLRDLMAKYERLAWSDGGAWVVRLKFASEQGAIKEYRKKFRDHQQLLQLVLTIDGGKRLDAAAKQDGETDLRDAQIMDERLPGNRDTRQGSLQHVKRITTATTVGTGTTLCNHRDSISSVSPRVGRRAFSVVGPGGQEDPVQPSMESRPLSVSTVLSKCSCCSRSHEKAQLSDFETDTSLDSQPSVQTAISSPNKTKQPLNLSLDREKHDASTEMDAAFRQSYDSLRSDFSAETWLRLATWWLVKSRIVCRTIALVGIQRRQTDASLYQDGWEVTISAEQAYTDLLKSSWILEVILAESNEDDLSYTHMRRIIKVLAVSLDRDFRDRRDMDSELPRFGDDVVLRCDLDLLEGFEQTIELVENVPGAIDDLAPVFRWFETDQDNAGAEVERVMYRTFVNAQLGTRAERSKSSSAPYMLLLWTTADESDLLISLCNHRGTINLSRKMMVKDLENLGHADGLLPVAIDFPSQDAEIKFLNPQELQDFFARPQMFFAAMQQRIPRPGELAIYQASIASYCDSSPRLHATDQIAASITASKTSACGITVYEAMPDKCWKTTRRLAIHSAPDSTEPTCASHWLPLDHVRISVDGPKVTVHWSDCAQLNASKPRNTEVRYSYIYKPEEPNRKIDLQFGSNSEALKFQECLLCLTDTPSQVSLKLNVSSAFQDVRIYRLFDADEPDNQYHGLVLTRKSPKGPYMTECFYAYRDLDWIIETKNDVPSIIRFPQLRYSIYNSTQPSLIYRPEPEDPLPKFSDVTEGFKAANVELGCDHDLARFMYSLTGWRLKYFRSVARLVIVEAQMIKDKKETFNKVDIQLWEKASEEGKSKTQLAVRFEGEVKERWMTASLTDNAIDSDRNTLVVREVLLQRGIGIDSKTMTAKKGGAEGQTVVKKRYKLAMTFCEGIDKEEFLRISGLY